MQSAQWARYGSGLGARSRAKVLPCSCVCRCCKIPWHFQLGDLTTYSHYNTHSHKHTQRQTLCCWLTCRDKCHRLTIKKLILCLVFLQRICISQPLPPTPFPPPKQGTFTLNQHTHTPAYSSCFFLCTNPSNHSAAHPNFCTEFYILARDISNLLTPTTASWLLDCCAH